MESLGTNRLIDIAGSLFNVIKNKMTLFIDELDSSLHPLLVKEVVKLFNTQENN
jgi:AAA15 family ATPase/GTPase